MPIVSDDHPADPGDGRVDPVDRLGHSSDVVLIRSPTPYIKRSGQQCHSGNSSVSVEGCPSYRNTRCYVWIYTLSSLPLWLSRSCTDWVGVGVRRLKHTHTHLLPRLFAKAYNLLEKKKDRVKSADQRMWSVYEPDIPVRGAGLPACVHQPCSTLPIHSLSVLGPHQCLSYKLKTPSPIPYALAYVGSAAASTTVTQTIQRRTLRRLRVVNAVPILCRCSTG